VTTTEEFHQVSSGFQNAVVSNKNREIEGLPDN